MQTIQIDFDVFKEITARRASESMTDNDVIRNLLKMKNTNDDPITKLLSHKAWLCQGILFPHGTEFRSIYKGQKYTGRVVNGALEVNGERYSSPSSAAVSITGSSVNGWRFWECSLLNSSNWTLIADMRK